MADMMPREEIKYVEEGGRHFRIRMLPVWDALYLAKIVVAKVVPVLNTFQLMEDDENGNLDLSKLFAGLADHLPDVLEKITQQDIRTIITYCLRYVDCDLAAGPRPVMVGDNFGVEGIESNFKLCIVLCYHALVHNCESFFEENGFNLEGAVTKLLTRLDQ